MRRLVRRPAASQRSARNLSLVIGLALVAIGAAAQPAASPPLPAPPRALKIDAPIELQLSNGLRVIVAQRPGVQLVTAQLLVLSGSETDPTGRAGLAAMTAGLLTKGTRRHTAAQMAMAAEALGGSLDSGAGWNRSGLSMTVAVPMLDAALALIAEAAREPTFAQDELDRLRAQTLDGLKLALTQPGTLASLAAERLVFGSGAYGHLASGTPASLPRLTRADVLAQHAAIYRPDNAVLVLAGDLTPATANTLAARHFGTWRRPITALPATGPSTADTGLGPRVVVIDMPESGQAGVTLAVPVPPRGLDRAAADVMNGVLGGGYSSRLNQEIRIKRGLSYGAGSRLDARGFGGALEASAQTKNESAAEVVGLLQGEFDRLASAPVPDDELAARKATLIGEFSRSVETTAGLNAVVSSLVVVGLPLTELGRRIDALSAVTATDVQRYAAANLAASGRRVVVAGEASRFAAALQAAVPGGAPDVFTVPARTLDLDGPAGLSSVTTAH